jgi:hypothetical protein
MCHGEIPPSSATAKEGMIAAPSVRRLAAWITLFIGKFIQIRLSPKDFSRRLAGAFVLIDDLSVNRIGSQNSLLEQASFAGFTGFLGK